MKDNRSGLFPSGSVQFIWLCVQSMIKETKIKKRSVDDGKGVAISYFAYQIINQEKKKNINKNQE